jgi:hypothetical protein
MKVEHLKVVGMEEAMRGMRNAYDSWDKADSYIIPDVVPGTAEFENKIKTYPVKLLSQGDTLTHVVENTNECIHYNPWTQNYNINKAVIDSEKYPDYKYNINVETDRVAIIGKNDMDLMQRLVSHDQTSINGGEPNSKYLRDITVTLDITASFDFWKEFDTYKVGTVANSCSTMHTITKHPITIENISTADLREKDIKNIEEKWLPILNEIVNDDSLSTVEKTRILSKMNLVGFEQKRTIKLNYQVIKNMDVWRMGHKLKEWRVLINVYFKNLPYVESLFFRNPYLKK